jgi:voltage-gated potassium channel
MWKPLVLFLCIILIGVIGFSIIEDLSFLDSLYMTVITIFTVGFREIKEPLSQAGQIFTIFIIISGVGTAVYSFSKVAEIVFEGGLRTFWRRRRMEKKRENLRDHYIICGHGRMGSIVREVLEYENIPYVVIDKNEEIIRHLNATAKEPVIHGDATHEDTLLKAGIKTAKGLAALLPTDADNLYLVLTVRLLHPSLFILSKALEEEGEMKILQIGANRIVNPYRLSGLRMAQGLIRPTLLDFMDIIIRRKELSLFMEEFIVKKESKLVNRNLKECEIRKIANTIVVAVKKPGEDIVFNPAPDLKLETGDTLLVLGDKKSINTFESVFIGCAR